MERVLREKEQEGSEGWEMGLAKKDGEYLTYSKEVLYVPSIVRLEDVTAKGKDMLGMLWPSWQGLKWWEMVARL